MTDRLRAGATLAGIFLFGALSAEAVPVSVRFQSGDGSPWSPVGGEVHFVALSPAQAHQGPFAAKTGADEVYDLPGGSVWRLEVTAPGLWIPTEEVRVGTSPIVASVTFFKAGELTGSLAVPPGAAVPRELSLRLRPAPGKKSTFPEAKTACTLDKSRFRCLGPAGDFDLRVRAPGYVTHYRWGTRIPAGRALDLGILQLQEGSSLVGWIEAPDPKFRFTDVILTVSPQVLGLGNRPALERRDSLELTEKPNDRGFFQFSGVPAGSYLLVAKHPRFAPTRIAPVEILERSETELRPISLELPADLTVTVSPPLDPYGRPWSLEIQRSGLTPDTFDLVSQGSTSSEGAYRARNLEPGPYRVAVTGSYLSRWRDEPLVVYPGNNEHEIRLPMVEVLGGVLYRDEPVMALLWFGGTNGLPRIPAKSGTDGKFKVVLPEREKPWRVDVTNELEGLYATFSDVEVKPSPATGKASLTLKLAKTVLRGEVVDEQGQKAAATVRVTGPGVSFEQKPQAPDNRFEFKALRLGSWNVTAYGQGSSNALDSETYTVQLAEDEEREIRLVLRPVKKLAGMVVGPLGQPVPGARVVATLEQGTQFLSELVPETYTDSAGLFELRLPGRTQSLQLTVMPPGFAIRQMRLDLRQTSSLTVPVGQVGGTVILDFGETDQASVPWWEADLFGDTRVGYPGMLRQWALLHGSDWTGARLPVPMLEPGRYTACRGVGPEVFVTGLPPTPGDRRCVSGELSAWGMLELRLPAPQSEGE